MIFIYDVSPYINKFLESKHTISNLNFTHTHKPIHMLNYNIIYLNFQHFHDPLSNEYFLFPKRQIYYEVSQFDLQK